MHRIPTTAANFLFKSNIRQFSGVIPYAILALKKRHITHSDLKSKKHKRLDTLGGRAQFTVIFEQLYNFSTLSR